ncbi:DUF2399 domain-containing protein [Megasphaera sp.]|uniref:Wadjet anti-phage system protein JetD domain-containing protein n=1 Tax=Megasphaera sp. TaxID=2023260 RepID=UPI0025B7BFA7|nr:DUF2399 domain-containing protein [Megasphaera sp.]MCF0152242.1 DUF2399 domain-containing protein [Megasphaera sp.]
MDTDTAAVRRFLQEYPKKTLDLDVLQAAFSSWDYDRFRPAVAALLKDGSLTAVRTGGVDFSGLPRRLKRVPARLFASVPVIQAEAIRLALSERLDFSFYYEQPLAVWQADLPYIEKLSAWLARGIGETTSLQQRSWDIFADEKYLLGPGEGLLKRLGLTTADLGICDQPDPLMMAVQPARLQQPVCHHLVVENKAPYGRLAPHLAEGQLTSIIFGCGWKIAANLDLLPQQCGCPHARHVVWYFGDFDWEGLRIWQAAASSKTVEVRLAVPFYEAFLAYEAPQGKANQQREEAVWPPFAAAVGESRAPVFRDILDRGCYYPQEALTENDLIRALKETLHGIRTFF